MKISIGPVITCWIIMVITPSITQAADWSVLTPEAVCSYLSWTDAKKIMLVGGGKNLLDVQEASEALKKNLQGCPKVSIVITAEAIGDVSPLDDASIITKAAKIPIDLVMVVRVFPEAGQSSMTVTFYNTEGETMSAFLADTRTTLVPKSVKQETAKIVDQRQPEAVVLERSDKQEAAEIGHQKTLKPRFVEHRHDGFFVRFSLMGLGYGNFSREGSQNISYKGFSSSVEVSVGYTLVENFIVHLGVSGPFLMNPTYTSDGISRNTKDVTVGSGGFVGGLTYYFMPYNLYLTAMVGAASMDVTVDNEKIAETDRGPSFQISFGKEWWTSTNWGMGFAGAFFVQSMEDQSSLTWTNVAGVVQFSATYN